MLITDSVLPCFVFKACSPEERTGGERSAQDVLTKMPLLQRWSLRKVVSPPGAPHGARIPVPTPACKGTSELE